MGALRQAITEARNASTVADLRVHLLDARRAGGIIFLGTTLVLGFRRTAQRDRALFPRDRRPDPLGADHVAARASNSCKLLAAVPDAYR